MYARVRGLVASRGRDNVAIGEEDVRPDDNITTGKRTSAPVCMPGTEEVVNWEEGNLRPVGMQVPTPDTRVKSSSPTCVHHAPTPLSTGAGFSCKSFLAFKFILIEP